MEAKNRHSEGSIDQGEQLQCKVDLVTQPASADRPSKLVRKARKCFSHEDSLIDIEVYKRLGNQCDIAPRLYQVQEIPESGATVYWFEFCEGLDLGRQIGAKRFGETELCEMTISILRAVTVLHKCGIAHCNLIPSNILITREGKYKVSGFGSCKFVSPTPNDKYFASDVKSLGIMFVQVASGSLSVSTDPVSVAAAINGRFPELWHRMIISMLQPPSRRISAQEAYEILASVSYSSVPLRSPFDTVNEDRLRGLDTVRTVARNEAHNNQEDLDAIPDVIPIPCPTPVLPPSPLQREFLFLYVELNVVMEHSNLQESLLVEKVEKLMKFNDSIKGIGRLSVKLNGEKFICELHKCDCLAYERCTLPCGHKLCRNCFNRVVVLKLSECRRTTREQDIDNCFTCTLCPRPFNPFDEMLRMMLFPNNLASIDQAKLRVRCVRCPNCGAAYLPENTSDLLEDIPTAARCSNDNCKKKFCTFCLKDTHLWSCPEWKKAKQARKTSA